jgi:hypothetical protein
MLTLFTVVCRKYICAILQTRIAQTRILTNRVGWHYTAVSARCLYHRPNQESRRIVSIKLPNQTKKYERLFKLRKLG